MGRPRKEQEENVEQVIPVSKNQQKVLADKALGFILNQINKPKKGAEPVIKIGFLGELKPEAVTVIPSGSLALDAALGVGGYPEGRIIEIFGPASSGKTTLALTAIAEAQKVGRCAFIDMEHSLDADYARALGVDIDELLFAQPESGDEAMEIIDALVGSGQFKMIILDSVAALTTAAELERDITANNMGVQARLMSQAIKRLSAKCGKTGTILLCTNQIRMKIGCVAPETEVFFRLTNKLD